MRTPKYRTRADKPWAFVEIGGKRTPLPGKANSKESLDAYHALCRRLLAESGETVKTRRQPLGGIAPPTVGDLIDQYTTWAEIRYVPRNGQRSCFGNILDSVRPLAVLASDKTIEDFGAEDLEAVRDAAVSGSWITEKFPLCKPWSRQTANRHIGRIRQMFRWGVKKKIVPHGVLYLLQSIEPLRKGYTSAIDYDPIAPVDPRDIEAVLPFVTPVVGAMVQLQRFTGMRPGEVCIVRPGDIDTSKAVWVYTPEFHKTTYLEHNRPIPMGPRAQDVLRPFMDRDKHSYCFSPIESEKYRSNQRRGNRRSRVQPSQAARKQKKRPERPKRDRYRTSSYRRAVEYGIAAANKSSKDRVIPHWHPNQLRHTAATLIRDAYGLEAAQVILGHSHASVTEIYAERDLLLAVRVASEVG